MCTYFLEEYDLLEDHQSGRKSTLASGRGGLIGSRRPGLMARQENPKRRAISTVADMRQVEQQDETDPESEAAYSRRMIIDPSNYGDLDVDEEMPAQPKVHNSWEPGKRGRPPLSQQAVGLSKSK